MSDEAAEPTNATLGKGQITYVGLNDDEITGVENMADKVLQSINEDNRFLLLKLLETVLVSLNDGIPVIFVKDHNSNNLYTR